MDQERNRFDEMQRTMTREESEVSRLGSGQNERREEDKDQIGRHKLGREHIFGHLQWTRERQVEKLKVDSAPLEG